MTTPRSGKDGYFHPASESEVADLVRWAAAEGLKLRVRGSGHSVPAAISPPSSGAAGPREGITVLLDRMIALSFDDGLMQVTAQAGCHLGLDPGDPSGTSTIENSLFAQLDQRGWAVPDMGGIIHQSVGGFLSTGSAGGSLKYSVYDAVIGIRLVDGQGRLREYRRPADASADPRDPFFGAVISMGLLGVVTSVTFQCVPKYHVLGEEATTRLRDAEVDLFAAGSTGLERFLRDTERTRLLWWPQAGVDKLAVWRARDMKPEDYNQETGSPTNFRRRPYELLPPILGSARLAQLIASGIFRLFGRLNPPPPRGAPGRLLDRLLGSLYPRVVNAMLRPTKPGAPHRFWDDWWRALPMDNEASDELLPTQFTEAWIPLEETQAVLIALRDHYRAHGYPATGTYACDLYGAKASPFWLSPAFGRDVVRIDLFWFGKNDGAPDEVYYPQFWRLLDGFQPRYHWGKFLPTDPAAVAARYPLWEEFLALRREHDPRGVFLTAYWRAKLGLTVT